MPTEIRQYVRSLALDAYVVGGAVRDELLGVPHADEDFLVPGVGQAELRALLEPHGRVEPLEVHGQIVGVRLHPHDRRIRRLAPKGIELTPPRAERSTGPGHRHFEIVTGADITLEDDMRRRDFTVNAMALNLATRDLIDPFGGRADLDRRELRTVTPESFREDPLRLLRALRLVSQLDFRLAPETLAQMSAEATGIVHVSPERIGGGLAADGQGELSKLLLGIHPRQALALGRDTGVLAALLPEVAAVVGRSQAGERHTLTLDEHLFATVQATADLGAGLEVRLAALLHDLCKTPDDEDADTHATAGAAVADHILRRLRYPTALRRAVTNLVAGHSFRPTDLYAPADVRRFLSTHGITEARDLVLLKRADLLAKSVAPSELAAIDRLEEAFEREATAPLSLADLAVDGRDLIALGARPGPELGKVLRLLLADVLEEPARNSREVLLKRARQEIA